MSNLQENPQPNQAFITDLPNPPSTTQCTPALWDTKIGSQDI